MDIKMKQAVAPKTRTVGLTQVDNVNFKIATESGFDIYTDEAVDNNGSGTAPRPLETVTARLPPASRCRSSASPMPCASICRGSTLSVRPPPAAYRG